jgi:hypothetical protein
MGGARGEKPRYLHAKGLSKGFDFGGIRFNDLLWTCGNVIGGFLFSFFPFCCWIN